jgi:phosphate-selective porin OprO/OprP
VNIRITRLVLPCLLFGASWMPAQQVGRAPSMSPRIESASTAGKDLRIQLGGRMNLDWASFADGDGLPANPDGAELRRARLSIGGDAYGWLEFKASIELTDGDAPLRDMWVQAQELGPVGRLRVGHFKEPFGLERLAAVDALLFLERSIVNELTPGRNIGIMVGDRFGADRASWTAGLFRTSDGGGLGLDDGGHDETAVTARLTWLPLEEAQGGRLVHVGAAASLRAADGGGYSLAAGPGVHFASALVDTGTFAADDILLLGAEAAAILGAFSIQAEWQQAQVDLPGGGEASFPAYHLQAAWALTGEARRYDYADSRFKSLPVAVPFHPQRGGHGAWELVARYAAIDLDSGLLHGGDLVNSGVGLNWYLNDDTRIMLQVTRSERDGAGELLGVALRFHFEW